MSTTLLGQTSIPPQSYLRNNSFVSWESAHVHPLDITPDGAKLLAVNTANNSLEVYTPSSGSLKFLKTVPVGLDPVTVRARTNTEAWVVNVISDSVSIVDLTNGLVTKTLQTGDEPADVVFAGSSQATAYVSCAGSKTLLAFNAAAPTTPVASIVIAGEQPRALAVDRTGRYVYLAIFESGNGTVPVVGGVTNFFENDQVRNGNGPYKGINVPPNNGNVFNPPINPALPAPPPVSLIVRRTLFNGAIQWLDDNLKDWSQFISGSFNAPRVSGWDLVDRDVAVVDTTNNSVTYQGGLMNILMAIGVNPSTNEITVVGTDATNQIRFEPVLQSTFVHVNFGRFTQGGSNTISDLNPHINYAKKSLANGSTVNNSIGDPRAIAWNSSGTQAYVTGMGSNNVAVVGPTGTRLGVINVGQGPTGLVLSNGFAYVLNKFDASISAINTSSNTVSSTTSLYFDPTPVGIRAGRPVLYNSQQTSGLGQASCASCHVDGRWDRLAWDLGNPADSLTTLPSVTTNSGNSVTFHPMKGPFLTMTLADTMQAPEFHWRGDRPVLENFAGAFNTLMGGTVATQTQIDQLRSFLASISLPPNPNRNLDNSYNTALPVLGVNNAVVRVGNAQAGAAEFEANCRGCHPGHTNRGPAYIDTNQDFGAGIRNPPTWKNFYKRTGLWFNSQTGSTAGFGFQQDGTFDSSHNNSRSDNMMAFMMSFNGGYPYEPSGLNATNWSNFAHAAVGKQVTLSPSSQSDTTGLLSQLIALGDSGSIGLVAKGGSVNGGGVRGWTYLGNGSWQSDHLPEVDSTATLSSFVAGGAAITFTAVPNESAVRIGIDMDGDGILDADDGRPNLADVAAANLALGGTASASSVWDSNHSAAQAIDGNTLGYFDQNSLLHTGGGTNDWFQEDLGTNAQISLIQLFNRWDCCANRLANVSIFVSQTPFASTDVQQTRQQSGVKEFFLSGTQGALAQIPMQTPGRYVRVQLNANGVPLQLAEVRIMGYPIASLINPGTQTVSVGTNVNLQIQATTLPAGSFSSFSAVNLPPGLTIGASSGTISGTVQSPAASSYTTTVTATGAGAGAPSVTFAWNISSIAGVTPTTTLPAGAINCTTQSGLCALPLGATATVFYGSGRSYFAKQQVTGSIACSTAAFGDPNPGSAKACYAIVTSVPSSATACAQDFGTCSFPAAMPQTVFYGAGNTFSYKLGVSGTMGCMPATFGADPLPGTVKTCYAVPTVFGSPAGVDLSVAFNVYAITNEGTAPPNGGADNWGYAYSSALFANSLAWSGVNFKIGGAGKANAVAGGTIALPQGTYSLLNMLAAGVGSAQANQTFTVNYTDGTSTTLVQSFSDWGLPSGFSGESVALSTAYRVTPSATTQNGPWRVYGYSFSLNSSKTLKSVTLPNNRGVIVFAMAVLPGNGTSFVTPVDLSGTYNRSAIANNGSAVSGIGNDGWAYSANLLGTSVLWSGKPFNIAGASGKSAVMSATIPMPAGNFRTLSFLGTAIYGAQQNQIFTVTYTDGTTTSFTQSLSDWGQPLGFTGESVAATTAYRVTPTGGTQNGPWNLYGYSLSLNSAKTVKSFTLPNNPNVVVMALDLSSQ